MIDSPTQRVRVRLPVITHDDAGTRIRFGCDGLPGQTSFEVRVNRQINPSPEALGAACVCFFLWPAMTVGGCIEMESPLPSEMRDNLDVLQEIFTTWYPGEFKPCGPVKTPPPCARGIRSPGRAAFFSGGVDSTFSLIRHRESLSELIFVIGFDIPANNKELADGVSGALRAAAERYGFPLLEICTDLRDFADRHVHWGGHYCGAAMAGLAHLLTDRFGEIIIPGSLTWKDQLPLGSHPFTDERWSSPSMKLHHDSCDVDRLEKIRAIVKDGEALRHLRVCWRNPENTYNCCRCEKCVRTIANLRALGALDAAITFPEKPGIDKLRALEIDHHLIMPFVEQTIGEATRSGDMELATALGDAMLNDRVARLTKVPKEFLAGLPGSPVWRDKTFPALRSAIVEAAAATDPAWTRGKILQTLTPEERQTLTPRSHRPWWRFWR